ncbi:MAG: hypothetical protein R2784_15830 [Saprospiraceae bacterium]
MSGQSGWMMVSHLEIDSFEFEDYLIVSCFTDEGEIGENKTAQRIFFHFLQKRTKYLYFRQRKKHLKRKFLFGETQLVVSENANRNKDFFDVNGQARSMG